MIGIDNFVDEKFFLREKLKSNIDIISVFCIAGFCVNIIFGFVIAVLKWNENFPAYMLSMTAVSVISMLCVSLICAKFIGGMKACINKYQKKTGLLDNFLLVLLGFSGCMTLNFIITIIAMFFPAISGSEVDIPQTDIYTVMFMTLAVAVAPAVCEEIAFRGFVMGGMSDFGQGFSVLATSFLFGMMHGSVSGIIFAFLAGMMFACVRKTSGSLFPAMIVHFLNNGIVVWVNALSKVMAEEIFGIIWLIFIASMFILFGISLFLVYRRNIVFFEFSSGESGLTSLEKVKIILTRPLLWVFIVFAGIMMLFSLGV